MKSKKKQLIVGAFAFFLPIDMFAFELATHGLLTNQAYNQSRLAQSTSLLSHLGLLDLNSPFGSQYYDFANASISKRTANAYEARMMPGRGDGISERIRGWLMRGAIREDDLSGTTSVLADPLSFGSQPWISDPDPAGNINRVCNHFLNPLNRSAMVAPAGANLANLGCPDFNVSAANWAIGTTDAFAPSPVEAGNYRNHFTVFSGREAMWRALTLTNKDGTPATRVAGDNQDQVRKAYWASTFRALGDVVHLVQDMAQPQHTRNEAHASDTAAILEKYTEARATNARTFRFDGTTLQADATPSLPALNSYSVPRFDRYSDYWSSASGTDSLDIGKGLADYSSRGFFTPNQSLGDPFSGFPRPVNVESAYTISKTPPPGGNPCPGLVLGFPEYAWANVPDTISGVPSNPVRMGSRSLLPSRWAISRCVLLDQGNLLIPRAVAYSAGLIDYFFRGQLEIRLPNEGVYAILDHSVTADNCKDNCGFKKIKLKLANSTPNIIVSGSGTVVPQTMPGGTLVAVAKFHRNKCYTTDLEGEYDSSTGETDAAYVNRCRDATEEIAVSQPLTNQSVVSCNGSDTNVPSDCDTKAQATDALTFTFTTPIPINATDLYLQVVYRGPLGAEQDAVVVATKDIPEVTYFSIVNVTDYLVCYNRIWYYKDANGNLPAAIPAMVEETTKELFYAPTPYGYWQVAFQPNESFATTAIARVNNIAPKEFARIAVLLDNGRRFNEEILGYYAPSAPPYTLASAGVQQVNYDENGNSSRNLNDFKSSTVRKVKAHVPNAGYKEAVRSCIEVTRPPEPDYPKPTVMKAVTITLQQP